MYGPYGGKLIPLHNYWLCGEIWGQNMGDFLSKFNIAAVNGQKETTVCATQHPGIVAVNCILMSLSSQLYPDVQSTVTLNLPLIVKSACSCLLVF